LWIYPPISTIAYNTFPDPGATNNKANLQTPVMVAKTISAITLAQLDESTAHAAGPQF